MTIPGVGLGFHSDPTKSTQYSPQIARRQRPQRQLPDRRRRQQRRHRRRPAAALPARGDPGVQLRHAALQGRVRPQQRRRDEHRHQERHEQRQGQLVHLAARQEHEREDGDREAATSVDKQDYRRYQYGGSFGGPIVQNKAHFFAAVERTQQDTTQAVDDAGSLSEPGRRLPDAEPREPVHGEGVGEPDAVAVPVGALRPQHQLAGVRRRPAPVPENWGDSDNTFNSINVNHNWVLGGSKLNEFVFQYADFANHILARTGDPQQTFPNGVAIGYNTNTPQTTDQHKFQFRDDFSWHVTGMGGLGHDFKAGVNFINEPKLYVTFSSGQHRLRLHAPHQRPQRPDQRRSRGNKAGASANLPMKQYGVYVQDDWRVTDRLTVNAGLRYDLRHRLPDRSVEDPELRRADGGGRGRPLQRRARVRRVRQEGPGGQEQHPAAHRRGVRPARRRQGRRARRLGHLLRLRLHEREHPVPGAERPGRLGRRLHA